MGKWEYRAEKIYVGSHASDYSIRKSGLEEHLNEMGCQSFELVGIAPIDGDKQHVWGFFKRPIPIVVHTDAHYANPYDAGVKR